MAESWIYRFAVLTPFNPGDASHQSSLKQSQRKKVLPAPLLLSVKAEQQVIVLRRDDDGWWLIAAEDDPKNVGYFPASFLRPLASACVPPADSKRRPAPVTCPQTSEESQRRTTRSTTFDSPKVERRSPLMSARQGSPSRMGIRRVTAGSGDKSPRTSYIRTGPATPTPGRPRGASGGQSVTPSSLSNSGGEAGSSSSGVGSGVGSVGGGGGGVGGPPPPPPRPSPDDVAATLAAIKKSRPDLSKMITTPRSRVINELITTEGDYVDDLDTLMDVFFVPLNSGQVMSRNELDGVFANLADLLALSRRMSHDLYELAKRENDCDKVMIGKYFADNAQRLSIYASYCQNQATSVETLEAKEAQNKQLKEFLSEACQQCNGLPIYSFLIKPVQRVCKYPLLLRELLKQTPETHPDYKSCEEAFDKMGDVVDEINEKKREAERTEATLEFTSFDGAEKFHVIAKQSKLVHHGALISLDAKNRSSNYLAYLFDDVIVLVKRGKEKSGKTAKSRNVCVDHMYLMEAKFINHADVEGMMHAFEMRDSSENNAKRWRLRCENGPDKLDWSKRIKSVLREHQKAMIRAKMKRSNSFHEGVNKSIRKPSFSQSTSKSTYATSSQLDALISPRASLDTSSVSEPQPPVPRRSGDPLGIALAKKAPPPSLASSAPPSLSTPPLALPPRSGVASPFRLPPPTTTATTSTATTPTATTTTTTTATATATSGPPLSPQGSVRFGSSNGSGRPPPFNGATSSPKPITRAPPAIPSVGNSTSPRRVEPERKSRQLQRNMSAPALNSSIVARRAPPPTTAPKPANLQLSTASSSPSPSRPGPIAPSLSPRPNAASPTPTMRGRGAGGSPHRGRGGSMVRGRGRARGRGVRGGPGRGSAVRGVRGGGPRGGGPRGGLSGPQLPPR